MPSTLTTCPFCGCGCGLYLRAEDQQVKGVFPSQAHSVSQGRLCTKGWHAYELSVNPARLPKPLVRKDGKLVETTWAEALEAAAKGLNEVRRQHGSQALAVLGSAACTNESNFALMRFARQVLGTNNVDFPGRTEWVGASGACPTSSIQDIDEADFILLIDADSGDEHPAITARLLRARKRGAKIIVIGSRRHRLAKLADLHLQSLPGRHTEIISGIIAGIFTSEAFTSLPDTVAESLAPTFSSMADYTAEKAANATGIPVEQIRQAAKTFAQAKKPMALLGRGPLRGSRGKDFVSAVNNLLTLGKAMGQETSGSKEACGWLALGAEANCRGAYEMGLHPALLSGYRPLADAAARKAFESAWGANLSEKSGLNSWEMKGAVRGMLIMGDDPVFSAPDPQNMRETLEGLDFLVVQDSLKGELVERADVVLPAAGFGEEDGTFTSLGGYVQRVRKAVPPAGEARPHWEIVCELARQMGADFGYQSPEEIMREIAALTPLYESISYQDLEEVDGKQLPAQGLRKAAAPSLQLETEPPAGEPEFPLWLGVDFMASSWEGDPVILACPVLRQEFSIMLKDSPAGFAEMSPADAKQLGLRNGSRIKVTARKGEFSTSLQISEEVPAGVVLLPFWLREIAFSVLETRADDGGCCVEPVQVKIEGA